MTSRGGCRGDAVGAGHRRPRLLPARLRQRHLRPRADPGTRARGPRRHPGVPGAQPRTLRLHRFGLRPRRGERPRRTSRRAAAAALRGALPAGAPGPGRQAAGLRRGALSRVRARGGEGLPGRPDRLDRGLRRRQRGSPSHRVRGLATRRRAGQPRDDATARREARAGRDRAGRRRRPVRGHRPRLRAQLQRQAGPAPRALHHRRAR